MKPVLLVPAFVVLSACTQMDAALAPPPSDDGAADAGEAVVETAVLAAPPPPPAARTIEQFDTTTAEQRAAVAAPAEGGALLGSTVASLGDPSRAGFWIETPLVSEQGTGRLVFPANGNSVEVELIPIPGADGAGSRVSLAAFRILGAPLTDLPTLEVYAN